MSEKQNEMTRNQRNVLRTKKFQNIDIRNESDDLEFSFQISLNLIGASLNETLPCDSVHSVIRQYESRDDIQHDVKSMEDGPTTFTHISNRWCKELQYRSHAATKLLSWTLKGMLNCCYLNALIQEISSPFY